MTKTYLPARLATATTTRRSALGVAGVGIVGLGLAHQPRQVAAQATPVAVPPVVARWATAWNAHDPAAMASLFVDDGLYEDLAFEASFRGKDGVAEWVAITSSVIPNAAVELVAAFQAGDRATAEWVFSSSQLPPAGVQGQEPGGTFSVRAASVFELEGDLIRRVTDYYNPTALRGQPGQADTTSAAAEPAATPST